MHIYIEIYTYMHAHFLRICLELVSQVLTMLDDDIPVSAGTCAAFVRLKAIGSICSFTNPI